MTQYPRANFRHAKARLNRATAFRDEMGRLRQEERVKNPFTVRRVQRGSVIELVAVYDPSPELEIVFGDWLANMRAAFDYLFFQLAVEDTKRNPPTRPGDRMFPVKRTRDDFDAIRTKDVFHGLSERTINAVESMQPYHTKYGADGNAILWLHDLARKDRHRTPFKMGALVTEFKPTSHPVGGARALAFDPLDPQKTPPVVGEGETLVLAKLRCASTDDATKLLPGIEADVSTDLEIIDWYRETHKAGISANIRNDRLEERMKFVEHYFGLVLVHFEKLLEIEPST